MSYLSKKIRENEEVIKKVYHYPLTLFLPVFCGLVAIFSAFFLLYPLFKLGKEGIGVFSFLVLVGFLILFKTFYQWSRTVVWITNQRIIIAQQKGFFRRIVSEVEFQRLKDIIYEVKGVFPNFFDYGTIKLNSFYRSGKDKIILKNIHHPQDIQELIIQIRDRVKRIKGEEKFLFSAEEILSKAPMEELVKVVRRIKEIMGEDKFRNLFIEEKEDDS